MALTLCSDVSAGDWIGASKLGWWKLVTLAPAGFGAYARLRFLPDPAYAGQPESEADVDAAPCATEQWRVLFELLGPRTGTPDDCYFCLWDGWPGLPQVVVRQPKLNVPHDDPLPKRRYFLSRGSLSAAADGASASSGLTEFQRTSLRMCGPPTTLGVSPTMSTRTGPGLGPTRP